MGYGRGDPGQWASYTSSIAHKSTAQVFTSHSVPGDLDPRNIRVRESRDSALNPRSTPILIMGDGTGSMGDLAEIMLRQGLKTLTTEVYGRKPVSDPHVAFGFLGDVHAGDAAPLQVTQFEADTTIAEQLERIWLGGPGGGGNGSESYHLAWYFAARKVEADAFTRPTPRKGFLFTYGDEGVPPPLQGDHIVRIFGKDEAVSGDLSAEALIAEAKRNWNVFHLIVEQGSGVRQYGRDHVIGGWKSLLGERAVLLSDHTKMAEVIVSLMQVVAGVDAKTVVSSWSDSTALVVQRAVGGLVAAQGGGSQGVVRL